MLDSFLGDGALTEFRIIFSVMIVILVLFLILSLFSRGKDTSVTFFSVLMNSVTHILIGGALMVVENMILMTHKWVGDRMTLILFLVVIGLSILNPIIYKLRNRKSGRSSGGYSYR